MNKWVGLAILCIIGWCASLFSVPILMLVVFSAAVLFALVFLGSMMFKYIMKFREL